MRLGERVRVSQPKTMWTRVLSLNPVRVWSLTLNLHPHQNKGLRVGKVMTKMAMHPGPVGTRRGTGAASAKEEIVVVGRL